MAKQEEETGKLAADTREQVNKLRAMTAEEREALRQAQAKQRLDRDRIKKGQEMIKKESACKEQMAQKEREDKEDQEARAAYESLRPEFRQAVQEIWNREGPGKETEEKLINLAREYERKFDVLKTGQTRWWNHGGRLNYRREVHEFLLKNDPGRIASHRKNIRGMYRDEGIVDKVEERTTKRGKPYLVFMIDGKQYVCWNPQEAHRKIRPGQEVFFTGYEENGGLEVDDITIAPPSGPLPTMSSRPEIESPGPAMDKGPESILNESSASFTKAPAPSVSPKTKKTFSSSDKLDFAINDKGALIMEKGSSLMAWLLGRSVSKLGAVEVISGKLDYQVGWIKFVVSAIIYRNDPPTETNPGDGTMIVSFTDQDFRRILKKPRISSRDIRTVVDKFAGVVLKMTSIPVLLEIDDKGRPGWKTIDISGPLAIIVTTTEYRDGEGEHRQYSIGFSTPAGKVFVNNILKKGFTILPPDQFLRLSPGAQNLFWTMGWHEGRVIFNLEDAAELLRWGEASSPKQRYDLRAKLEACLDELKKAGFISTWTKDKTTKAGKLTWKYQVNKSVSPIKALTA